jgi:hypothetical protein
MTIPLALLCPILAFGLVLIVLVKIVGALQRSNARNRFTGQPTPNLTTSMADDGFWISGDQVDPSGIIHYVYWSGAVQRAGQVPFQPGADGRQFIYTGARPDRVTVALADAADAGAELLERSRRMSSDPPVLESPDPTPAPSSGFPSAY